MTRKERHLVAGLAQLHDHIVWGYTLADARYPHRTDLDLGTEEAIRLTSPYIHVSPNMGWNADDIAFACGRPDFLLKPQNAAYEEERIAIYFV